jgi:hypothetical protein
VTAGSAVLTTPREHSPREAMPLPRAAAWARPSNVTRITSFGRQPPKSQPRGGRGDVGNRKARQGPRLGRSSHRGSHSPTTRGGTCHTPQSLPCWQGCCCYIGDVLSRRDPEDAGEPGNRNGQQGPRLGSRARRLKPLAYHARRDMERASPRSRAAVPTLGVGRHVLNEATPKIQRRHGLLRGGRGPQQGKELAPLKSLAYHAQRDTANATCVFGTPLPPAHPSRCDPRRASRERGVGEAGNRNGRLLRRTAVWQPEFPREVSRLPRAAFFGSASITACLKGRSHRRHILREATRGDPAARGGQGRTENATAGRETAARQPDGRINPGEANRLPRAAGHHRARRVRGLPEGTPAPPTQGDPWKASRGGTDVCNRNCRDRGVAAGRAECPGGITRLPRAFGIIGFS